MARLTPAELWLLAVGAAMRTSLFNTAFITSVRGISTACGMMVSLKRCGLEIALTMFLSTAAQASRMPLFSRQAFSMCSILSGIRMLAAPASLHMTASSRTTSGLVLVPASGGRAKDILGLMTTRLPGLTKRCMPPSSSTAARVAAARSPLTIDTSGTVSAMTVFGIKSPLPPAASQNIP